VGPRGLRIIFFSMEKETKINWEQEFLHQRVSAVNRVSLLMIRCHIVLRGRWCNLVLKAIAPGESNSDASIYNFYKELENRFCIIFPVTYKILVCYEILMQNSGKRIFSNRQLGIRAYTMTVMIMVLE
jgi:hypothetical protein